MLEIAIKIFKVLLLVLYNNKKKVIFYKINFVNIFKQMV
jgi:hypothetical protein